MLRRTIGVKEEREGTHHTRVSELLTDTWNERRGENRKITRCSSWGHQAAHQDRKEDIFQYTQTLESKIERVRVESQLGIKWSSESNDSFQLKSTSRIHWSEGVRLLVPSRLRKMNEVGLTSFLPIPEGCLVISLVDKNNSFSLHCIVKRDVIRKERYRKERRTSKIVQ